MWIYICVLYGTIFFYHPRTNFHMKSARSVLSHTIFLHQPLNQSSRGICSQNKSPVLRTHWTRPFTPKCLLQGCRKQRGRSAEHWATSCVCWIWHIPHLFLKLWKLPSLACNFISLVLALFLVWSSLDFRESQFLRTYSPHQGIGNVVHKHMSSCYSAVRPTGLRRRNKELPTITSVVVIKQSWLKHAQYKNDINDLLSNYESVFSQVEKTTYERFCHSFNSCLLNTCSVPGCVLGSRDTEVNDADCVLIASLPV